MNLAQLFLIICCSLSCQQALAAVGLVEDEVSYEVGDDFCLDEDSPPVELTCGGTGTTVKWLHDGAVVFDGEKMNMDFFMNGTNILLAPGVVNPPPFILKDDYSITFNLQAPTLSLPLADHPEITSDNIQINIFEGSWTCVQQNTHNTVSETSNISPCGPPSGTLSFETSNIVAKESDGHVEACVESSGTLSQFRVRSVDSSALASSDYTSIDAVMDITGDRDCFQVALINDDIAESVESFDLYLEAGSAEDNVTIIQRTLSVIITDDDATGPEEPTCSLDGFLFIDKIAEEKEHVIEAIRNVLPLDLPAPVLSGSETPTEVYYNQLADYFNESTSPAGRDQVSGALDEIFAAYASTCDESGGLPADADISSLAGEFNDLTKELDGITQEALNKARDIFGKFLCFSEKETQVMRVRRDIAVPRPVSACASGPCPATVTKACEFFACLKVSVTKHIAGFGNNLQLSPCISFVVDTTGSMGEEIASARRVILEFIKSQADSTTCYLLVEFNDYGPSNPNNVGPTTFANTTGSNALNALTNFENAVNALYAHGGGDTPEYCFGGIIAALDYTNNGFQPMLYGSAMIVITDADSHQPELRPTVISKAQTQGVEINFILSYSASPNLQVYYGDIATATGGTTYDAAHTAWSILQFYNARSGTTVTGRKKRSALSDTGYYFTVSVSRLAYALKVSLQTIGLGAGQVVTITLPDGSTETATVQENVLIYLKSSPPPGEYLFNIAQTSVQNSLIQQDVTLDASVFYTDKNFTSASLNPLAACTSGIIALTSLRISDISSLSLLVTDSSGSTETLPLTKCSNVFTTEYEFTAGEYSYKVEGTDVDGVQFSKDLAKSVVVENGPSDAYSFEAKDSSTLEVDSGNSFTIEFELKSNDKFGTTSFSLSSSLDGFTLTLDSTNVELQPMAVQTITLTGSNIGSAGVGVNTITVTASNGCQTLTATRQVTIKGVVTPPTPPPPPTTPPTVPPSYCDCVNGGICTERFDTYSGRVYYECVCPAGYTGFNCENIAG